MIIDNYGPSYAREDVAVSTTVTTLTQATFRIDTTTQRRIPNAAFLACESQDIRFTLDGTSPNNGSSPPVGTVLPSGSSMVILGEQNIRQFRAIRAGGVDGVLHVEYFG